MLGTSVHRRNTPKTRPRTLKDTAVEITDTMAYRNIFFPVGVWYRRHRRFTVATIRANLA